MTFICRPASVDIEFLLKKKSQKKFAVNNRDPRRARWDFRDLLDDSLLLYLKFGMNTYLKY